MSVEFDFREVEEVLQRLNRIAESKRVAFRGRIKHLQRLGFPRGANTGTGTRVRYTFPMLLQLALATELMQTGMSPVRIVQTINWSWHDQMGGLFFAMLPKAMLSQFKPPVEDNDLAWVLSPEGLRDLTEEGDHESAYMFAVLVFPTAELPSRLKTDPTPVIGEVYRHIVIQLRPFMQRVLGAILGVRPDLRPEDLGKAFENYLIDEHKRVGDLVDLLDRPKRPENGRD
ncbi:hypothetical protein GGQ97_002650 [Sphingomonas kaistensis]|uniref:Uncharacterized protein n=1 Tax=Sphingomonas kaistensis TaxID=298708 RepID=A0A7X5Y955_9SPHN|nr:hypothetical protein [Sphingomonas kaistensis]NJC06857.1 hypothetical protein [Sphingomonas kaistensis]